MRVFWMRVSTYLDYKRSALTPGLPSPCGAYDHPLEAERRVIGLLEEQVIEVLAHVRVHAAHGRSELCCGKSPPLERR